jgi:hypothetical protein
MDQAQGAAAQVGMAYWGDVTLISSTTLLRSDGAPSAFAFVYGRHGVNTISQSNILAGYALRQAGQETAGWAMARQADDYAYVIMAVDNQYGPVLETCDGLPAHMIFTEDVKAMGRVALGTDVQISANYYLAPLENWYEVTNGAASVVVNPRRLMNLTPSVFAGCGSLYDFPGSNLSLSGWTALFNPMIAEVDDPVTISGVPNFNQADTDCGPHSSAQTVGYWDNHTYQSQGPWTLLIDNDFWGLRDQMRQAMGWQPGQGVTVQEIAQGIIAVCNSSAYNNNYNFTDVTHDPASFSDVTTAINGGRPAEICCFNHPTYGNHAMSLVGYDTAPSQMVQVHDNWPPDTDEPFVAWGPTFEAVVDVFPSGGTATPITLASFTGNFENDAVQITWVTASEIDCYGYNVLRSEGSGFAAVNAQVIPAAGSPVEMHTYTFVDPSVQAGKAYTYRLETIFLDGGTELSIPVRVQTLRYDLAQNNPNPFNASTAIRYMVPEAGDVTLTVFDAAGRQVAELVRGYQVADAYTVNFDASGLTSGVYLYRLHVGNYTDMKKMVLLK